MAQTCPTCGALHTDATDVEAESEGLLYFAEAARRFGRSTSYVHGLIRSGAIRTTRFAGRDYIDESSVERIIASVGVPSAREQRLAHLQETGRSGSQEALGIQDSLARSMAEQSVLDGTAGLWGGRSVVDIIKNTKPTNDVPTLGDRFVAKFGRKS